MRRTEAEFRHPDLLTQSERFAAVLSHHERERQQEHPAWWSAPAVTSENPHPARLSVVPATYRRLGAVVDIASPCARSVDATVRSHRLHRPLDDLHQEFPAHLLDRVS